MRRYQPTPRPGVEKRFCVTQCIPCHQLNGGGASDIGPDLGQPMGPTDYLTEAGLRALVRDPKSVRTWLQQQMPAFPQAYCRTLTSTPSSRI